MKKIIFVVITIIGLLALTGCGGPKTYDEIGSKELNEMIKNKEDFVLFIGSETCSACLAYKIAINKIVENHGIDIKYIDIAKLNDKENSELVSNFAFSATPTTVFVKNGKEENTYSRITGNAKYSKIEEKLKEHGYIKESKNG